MSTLISTQIIEYIRTNRVSTTEVADALGKEGAIFGLVPVNTGKHAVGPIRGAVAVNGSNFRVHEVLADLKPGEIFMISCDESFGNEALIGDLVSRSALMYSQAAAIVVEGNVRDFARLMREDYAIWCKGRNPVGATNERTDINKSHAFDGGIAVCDDGGVVVISPDRINLDFLTRLHQIERQEDIWYYCLNTLKWNTVNIVCDKLYESDREVLPDALKSL